MWSSWENPSLLPTPIVRQKNVWQLRFASSATTLPCVAQLRDYLGQSGQEKPSSVTETTAKLPEDFIDLLTELHEAKVEFLLIGGWAVVLYGHVRSTDDIDIFVRATLDNSQRVYEALEKFGAPLSAHKVTAEHFATEGDAYRFGVAPLKAEVLTKISGVTFDEALQGSGSFDLNGRAIPYIGRAALIRNKKAAGRHKDLADVEELERT